MSTDDVRRSISATLAEIEQGHQALGIPAERDEVAEALAIIERIEAKWPALRKRRPGSAA